MNYVANLPRFEGDPKLIRSGPSSLGTADRLARALGWFSIGLGLAELLAPGWITRALGMKGRENLVRAYGAREIGVGVLSLSPDKGVGLKGRVIGDGLDIATLMSAMGPRNPKRDNVGLALSLVIGVTILDILASQAAAPGRRASRRSQRDYRDRSGFPQGLQRARGAAREANPGATSAARLAGLTE
jgi:hypothetical protein